MQLERTNQKIIESCKSNRENMWFQQI